MYEVTKYCQFIKNLCYHINFHISCEDFLFLKKIFFLIKENKIVVVIGQDKTISRLKAKIVINIHQNEELSQNHFICLCLLEKSDEDSQE